MAINPSNMCYSVSRAKRSSTQSIAGIVPKRPPTVTSIEHDELDRPRLTNDLITTATSALQVNGIDPIHKNNPERKIPLIQIVDMLMELESSGTHRRDTT